MVEVIVSLVLVGIMSAVIGIGMVYVVQGFVFTKMNATTLLKGQIAMSRISMELKNISLISDLSTATAMIFDSYKDNIDKTRGIRLNGDKVELNDGDGNFHPLTDQVATGDGFKFRYYVNYDDAGECTPASAKIIVVTLRLVGPDGMIQTFTERVTPRNM